jgi:hypothetical protein
MTSQTLERLLTDAIRRQQAAGSLLEIADRMAKAGIAPMSIPAEALARIGGE